MSSSLMKSKVSLFIMGCLSFPSLALTTQAQAGLFDNYTDTAQSFRSSLTQPV
jgi:hypothetical protein